MQSKWQSHKEMTINMVTGFFMSWLLWIVMNKYLIEPGYLLTSDGFYITLIFTVASYIRGYIIRRLHNKA